VIGRVVQIEALDDGRYGLVAVGTWRFRVRSWLPDDPYPLADIDAWPDDDPDDPQLRDLIATARERIRDIHRRVAELSVQRDTTTVPDQRTRDAADPEISDDPLLATYHLAGIAPLGPADRYRLLCAGSPRQRLELLEEALDDVVAMIEFRRT
jgi:Lon protease-like protein